MDNMAVSGRQSLQGIKTLRAVNVERKPLHVSCGIAIQELFSFMGRFASCNAQESLNFTPTKTAVDTRVFAMNELGKWKMVRF